MRMSSLVLMTGALLVAANNPKDDKKAKTDLDKFQGSWLGVEITYNGEQAPKEAAEKIKLTVKGDKWTFEQVDGNELKGTLKLDEKKKPKELDATTDDGRTILGIYEVDGDKLKLCYAEPGGERAKEFSSKAGSSHTLAVYKRSRQQP
jgi:uncharacterized protein (TIGR03067 family)